MWDISVQEYSEIRARLDSELTGRKFPEKAVSGRYRYFYLVDFLNMFARPFFNALTDYLKEAEISEFVFLVTDPEPLEYYYKNWGRIPAFGITRTMIYEEYCTVLNMDPGNSPADALITNGWEIFVFPPDLSMIFYFSRESEFGVGCFEREETYLFFARFEGDSFIDPNQPDVWPPLIPSVEAYRKNYLG